MACHRTDSAGTGGADGAGFRASLRTGITEITAPAATRTAPATTAAVAAAVGIQLGGRFSAASPDAVITRTAASSTDATIAAVRSAGATGWPAADRVLAAVIALEQQFPAEDCQQHGQP